MSLKSLFPAVAPLMSTVVPGTRSIVAGTRSSRSVASEASASSLSPVPRSGTSTTASVLSGLTRTSIGSDMRPLATACSRSSAIPARTAGDVTSAARTTTSAGSVVPGNAACTRS